MTHFPKYSCSISWTSENWIQAGVAAAAGCKCLHCASRFCLSIVLLLLMCPSCLPVRHIPLKLQAYQCRTPPSVAASILANSGDCDQMTSRTKNTSLYSCAKGLCSQTQSCHRLTLSVNWVQKRAA